MTGLGVTQISVTALLFLAAGYLIVLSLRLVPGKAELAQDLFKALLSMSVVAVSLLAVFLLGSWTLVPALLLLNARVGFEAAHVRLGPNRANFGAAAGLGLAMLVLLCPIAAIVLAGVWCLLLARFVMVGQPEKADRWKWVELLVFPLIPAAVLAWAALNPDIRPVVLIAYILIETFDSYALVSGKLFGRTKAFPVLSPRKTVEGLLGGAVCLVLTALVAAWLLGLPIIASVAIACCIGFFAIAGDLAASRLKRAAGVKDYPVVLPKQGGLLDVTDSWIAAGAAVGVLVFAFGGG